MNHALPEIISLYLFLQLISRFYVSGQKGGYSSQSQLMHIYDFKYLCHFLAIYFLRGK